jgi:hypothetical protein
MAWTQSDTHGGNGGDAFSDDLTQVLRLAGFRIIYGSYVNGIQPTFLVCGDRKVTGILHGGEGAEKKETVELAPDEIVRSVDGRSGTYVDQLLITTNKATYGPYGGQGGSAWTEDRLDSLGGFYGRSGKYLDQIGLFTPCPNGS